MEADIIITVALVTGAVLIIGQLARMIRAFALHRTVRQAIDKNSDLPPDLLARIEEQQPAGATDDRTGLVLIALALAIFGFGLIQGDHDDIQRMASIALFPLFVGAVLFGRHWYNKSPGAGA